MCCLPRRARLSSHHRHDVQLWHVRVPTRGMGVWVGRCHHCSYLILHELPCLSPRMNFNVDACSRGDGQTILHLQRHLAGSEAEGEALVHAHQPHHCLSIRQLHPHARPATITERSPAGPRCPVRAKKSLRAIVQRVVPVLGVPLNAVQRGVKVGATGDAEAVDEHLLPGGTHGSRRWWVYPERLVDACRQVWKLLQVIEGWHGGAPEGVDLLQKPGLRCGVVGQVVDGESQGTGRCLVPSIHEHADLSADLCIGEGAAQRLSVVGPQQVVHEGSAGKPPRPARGDGATLHATTGLADEGTTQVSHPGPCL
mmetsp:Transcript_640/g.1870  ORF Transcript_640/g.1870 Transcript_640/m.1870 type:complete len:311 (+) Transcript_640:208-1140(+)